MNTYRLWAGDAAGATGSDIPPLPQENEMTPEPRPENARMNIPHVHSDILQWLCIGVFITTVTIILRGAQEDVLNVLGSALGGNPVSLMIAIATIGVMLILGALDSIILVLRLVESVLERIIEALEKSEARSARGRSASDDT